MNTREKAAKLAELVKGGMSVSAAAEKVGIHRRYAYSVHGRPSVVERATGEPLPEQQNTSISIDRVVRVLLRVAFSVCGVRAACFREDISVPTLYPRYETRWKKSKRVKRPASRVGLIRHYGLRDAWVHAVEKNPKAAVAALHEAGVENVDKLIQEVVK